jgi:galactokinase
MRTAVEGFADLCLATRPPDPLRDGKDRKVQSIFKQAAKDFWKIACCKEYVLPKGQNLGILGQWKTLYVVHKDNSHQAEYLWLNKAFDMRESDYLDSLGDHDLLIQSPGRINLIGEHTDYNKGYCLPAAIRQSLFLGISESTSMKFRALDTGDDWGYGNQQNPNWMIYLRGVLDFLVDKGINVPPLDMEFGGTLPMGAGLSSSSALTCGFLFGINEWMALNLPVETMTAWAVQAERASGLMGGMMDQISIFNGSKDKALLINCSDWTFGYHQVEIPGFVWLIADTGVKHKLVDSDYNNRSKACMEILNILQQDGFAGASISDVDIVDLPRWEVLLSEEHFRFLSYVLEENRRVLSFVENLAGHNAMELGRLLLEGHAGLRDKYRVSCPELDFMIDLATDFEGVMGARMMGGGFGGSTLHILKEDAAEAYKNALTSAYRQRFGWEPKLFEAEIEDGVRRIH